MDEQDITQIINAPKASLPNKAFNEIYQELRQIASSHRRRWHGNDTLNTTALIHEAFERLAPRGAAYKNRKHFFATAAKIMRQVLVNYAERTYTQKRNPKSRDIEAHEDFSKEDAAIEELLAIEQLLKQLESRNERQCRIVECRVFGGMNIEETASTLQISSSTVKREWTLLSAWLYRELKSSDKAGGGIAKSTRKATSC